MSVGEPPEGEVVFVNTFSTSAPFLDEMVEYLDGRGWEATALKARTSYRRVEGEASRGIWVPPGLRTKRGAALWYTLVAPWRILFRRRASFVFLTQPPMFFVLGALICRVRRIPYAVHVMDYHPTLFGVTGMVAEGGRIEGTMERAAGWALRGASRVFVLGRVMHERIRALGVPAERIRITHNWASRGILEEGRRAAPLPPEIARVLDDEACTVVLYAGNMGAGHDFDALIGAAERLRDRGDVVFLGVGEGVRKAELEAAAARGLPIRLMGFQPLDRLARLLRGSTLHLVSLREEMSGLMVPSKFYTSLAVGRPVVFSGPAESEVGLVIEEEGCGAVVPEGDADALARVVADLADHPGKAEAMGRRARDAYRRRFDPEVVCRAYAADLREAFERVGAEDGDR